MNIQLHKESGLSIRAAQSGEVLYRDSFENALLDAELKNIAWLNEDIIRIFNLVDGRIAVVRETEAGLRQEAADSAMQNLLRSFMDKHSQMLKAKAERQVNQNNEDLI